MAAESMRCLVNATSHHHSLRRPHVCRGQRTHLPFLFFLNSYSLVSALCASLDREGPRHAELAIDILNNIRAIDCHMSALPSRKPSGADVRRHAQPATPTSSHLLALSSGGEGGAAGSSVGSQPPIQGNIVDALLARNSDAVAYLGFLLSDPPQNPSFVDLHTPTKIKILLKNVERYRMQVSNRQDWWAGTGTGTGTGDGDRDGDGAERLDDDGESTEEVESVDVGEEVIGIDNHTSPSQANPFLST